jgi:hypothetical protein
LHEICIGAFKLWLVQGLYWIISRHAASTGPVDAGSNQCASDFDDNDNGNQFGHHEETNFHLSHSFLIAV